MLGPTRNNSQLDFVKTFLALPQLAGDLSAGRLYYTLFGGDYGRPPKPYVFTVRVRESRITPLQMSGGFRDLRRAAHGEYYLDREHLLLRSICPTTRRSVAGWSRAGRARRKGRFALSSRRAYARRR